MKVFLPGITDTTTLQAASTLCGQAAWKIRGQEHRSHFDIAAPDMIRQLPAGFALVIRGHCAAVIARLPRAWNNPAYRRARRHHLAPDRLFPLPAAPGFPPGAQPQPWPAEPADDTFPDYLPPGWVTGNDDLSPGDDPSFPWS